MTRRDVPMYPGVFLETINANGTGCWVVTFDDPLEFGGYFDGGSDILRPPPEAICFWKEQRNDQFFQWKEDDDDLTLTSSVIDIRGIPIGTRVRN